MVPYLKEGDHEVASNNRPISLLPALSEVVEWIAHEQIVHYLTSTISFQSIKAEIRNSTQQKILESFSPGNYTKAIDEHIENKLTLNLDKTKSMIIGSDRKLRDFSLMSVSVYNTVVSGAILNT